MAPTRDSLQRISGINAEIEKLLNVQGVTRYSQIASWGNPEVERFDRLLGSAGRVRRESWIEQAQMLAKGGETSGARASNAPPVASPAVAAAPVLTPVAAAVPAPAGPSSAASSIGTAPLSAAAAAAAAAAIRPAARLPDVVPAAPAAAPAVTKPDLGNLRSVKSEAFTTPAAAARSGAPDDLKRIRGVGVLIEKRLNALGVTNYDQVANWTADDIARYSQQLDFKGRIERENWVEQARILASGGFTEFSRRVDRGEVESSRSKP